MKHDSLNGKDYQPRCFTTRFTKNLMEIEFRSKTRNQKSKRTIKKQIQKLEDSDYSQLNDAQWLLSNTISTLYQDIADNTLNQLFIAKEFPIAKKYDELLSGPQDQLSRRIRFVKELSDK
jgi:hypothetical protein